MRLDGFVLLKMDGDNQSFCRATAPSRLRQEVYRRAGTLVYNLIHASQQCESAYFLDASLSGLPCIPLRLCVAMTIDQSVRIIDVLLIAGFALAILVGWRQIQEARKLPYFLLRRERILRGWRWLVFGVVLGIAALVVRLFGQQIAYIIVPPTPSITPTPTITPTLTITPTKTITHTPTVSLTPTITPTSTITPTPHLPEELVFLIRETVTPNPEALFSPIQVAERLDNLNRPLNPSISFDNPLEIIFGAFTYNNLEDGVRWTAIWRRAGEIVCIETQAWDGGTGGYGYTECDPDRWLPGDYEIQMFLGETWLISNSFTVVGDPPTSTPIPSPTSSPSIEPTP